MRLPKVRYDIIDTFTYQSKFTILNSDPITDRHMPCVCMCVCG